MKIKLESTSQIVELNGIECRVWEGTTESGVPLTAFIPRVAVHRDHDPSQFERELTEQREPRAGVTFWPLRMVL
jgi:hypothetical protein